MLTSLDGAQTGKWQGAVQLARSLGQAAELVTEAERRGADMVFLPEACDFIGENRKQTLTLSQTLDGSTVTRFR